MTRGYQLEWHMYFNSQSHFHYNYTIIGMYIFWIIVFPNFFFLSHLIEMVSSFVKPTIFNCPGMQNSSRLWWQSCVKILPRFSEYSMYDKFYINRYNNPILYWVFDMGFFFNGISWVFFCKNISRHIYQVSESLKTTTLKR